MFQCYKNVVLFSFKKIQQLFNTYDLRLEYEK
jgi:hypothetical protein